MAFILRSSLFPRACGSIILPRNQSKCSQKPPDPTRQPTRSQKDQDAKNLAKVFESLLDSKLAPMYSFLGEVNEERCREQLSCQYRDELEASEYISLADLAFSITKRRQSAYQVADVIAQEICATTVPADCFRAFCLELQQSNRVSLNGKTLISEILQNFPCLGKSYQKIGALHSHLTRTSYGPLLWRMYLYWTAVAGQSLPENDADPDNEPILNVLSPKEVLLLEEGPGIQFLVWHVTKQMRESIQVDLRGSCDVNSSYDSIHIWAGEIKSRKTEVTKAKEQLAIALQVLGFVAKKLYPFMDMKLEGRIFVRDSSTKVVDFVESGVLFRVRPWGYSRPVVSHRIPGM